MARTTITRLRTKASQDRSELDHLLDSVHIGHFALVAEDGQPVVLPITEWSLKVSDGWPDDAPEDCDGPAWAGVIPVQARYRAPIPAPGLRAGIPVPESVRRIRDSSV